jgi:hypothetical protein
VVNGVHLPPPASTLYSGEVVVGANTITLSRFQVPPPGGVPLSHSGVEVPPLMSSFRSFPFAKKPMARPSADQKGKTPASVPGMVRDVCDAYTEPVAAVRDMGADYSGMRRCARVCASYPTEADSSAGRS